MNNNLKINRIKKAIILCLLLLTSICGYSQSASDTPICGQGNQQQMDTIPPVTDSILVSASSDPNEIIGTRGYDNLGDTMQWVAATASLPYTIYFKNDAKLASRVTITVPLHEKLNYTTFWVGNCSHVL